MKPYKLTFQRCPGYLYVRLEAASIDAATAMEYNRAMAAKCDELELTKILVVREIPMMMGTVDIYDVTNDFIEVMRGKKVAYVNPYAAIGEDLKFSAAVAFNRGARMRVFASEDEAKDWLLS
jgi:hypothetical protein